MSTGELHAVLDPSVGDWIAPRLRGGFGAVCRTVPSGYATYARVLHPVDPRPAAEPTTWAGVCERTGRTAHALMQWEAITTPAAGAELPTSREGRWGEVRVERGSLHPRVLEALLDVLAPFTGDRTGQQECYQALWEGWGWLTGASALVLAFSEGPGPHAPEPVPATPPDVLEEALNAPRLPLPGRDHVLLTGPLHAALATGHQVTDDWFSPQSPNLLWPADRSWCLASEIDFDSTLIGGPAQLIDAILAAPAVEAWAVGEDDDLSSFGDHLNT
ncbi:hypothetical protein [Kineococcus esterisolvens]|uniref:hypothetical protein n=1 Tax=unclassified Kineococcus TaxID=2621656 RepID=UPI003D7E4D06